MKNGPLWFPVDTHKYVELSHHLEVYLLPANFGSISILIPFIRYDEVRGRPREVVETF